MIFNVKFFSLLSLLAVVHAQTTSESATTDASSTSTDSSLPPDTTNGISPCIITCVTTAAADNGCSNFADTSCVCTSAAFQADALQCLQSSCTPADVTAATQLQQQQCAGISASGASSATSVTSAISSGSVSSSISSAITSSSTRPATSTSGSSSSRSSSTSSTSSAATTSNTGNAASKATFELGGILALGVTTLGAIVGGLIL